MCRLWIMDFRVTILDSRQVSDAKSWLVSYNVILKWQSFSADHFDERAYNITPCYSVLTLIWHWYCMTLQSKQTGIMGVFGDLGGGLKFLVVSIILLPIPLNMSYWEKQKPWLVEADEVYFGEQPYSCIVECFEMHQEWNFLTNLVCKWGRYSDCYVTSPADNLSFSDAHFELWKASFAARQKRQHRLTTRTVVHLETFLWGCGHCPFK